ncbi:Transposon TX1 uncharacterized [Smittium culicis]|uniref:Transposon TX1 uncharacterized n=1 Tax=Smittium culicis TaxID=133412 RepID=A0A1R1X311_9FUNG|nr:Transposon TX1 uncharacterized [Smittium culicis]
MILNERISPKNKISYISELESNEKELLKIKKEKLDWIIIRSRSNWAEKEEKSNKYFFGLLKYREKSKTISGLYNINNQLEKDNTEIRNIVHNYYSSLFKMGATDCNSQLSLTTCIKKKMSNIDQKILDKKIEYNEIISAIEESPNNKSLGPDCLSFEFYKKFKERIANHLINIFNKEIEMQKWNTINGGSVRALIPKRGDLKDLKNYCPITLSNCDEKIYTKILTKRVQNILFKVIDRRQSGFIKGRNIFDNIYGANFLIENSKINPHITNGYLQVLDQEKAYDRVDWGYLFKCLEGFGFTQSFKINIKNIYLGSKTKVTIKKTLTEPIKIEQGLRQGNPLLPLLYNIIIEPALINIDDKTKGIPVDNNNFKYLAYADDLLIGIGDKGDEKAVEDILETYSLASNAKINKEKTMYIKIGEPKDSWLTNKSLGPTDTFNYLGIVFTESGVSFSDNQTKLEESIHSKMES